MNQTFKRLAKPVYQVFANQATKKKIERALAENDSVYLELGAGKKKGSNGWLTIDLNRCCDLSWDLRKGIPFPDNSLEKLYSSHLFEHLSYRESQKFLDECLRVLKPGGTFSICVPNARIYIEAYVNRDTKLEGFFGHKPAYNNTTRIDYVNYVAYLGGEHKHMFDEDSMLHILSEKGFKNVRLRDFDPETDLEARHFESLYAIGEK